MERLVRILETWFLLGGQTTVSMNQTVPCQALMKPYGKMQQISHTLQGHVHIMGCCNPTTCSWFHVFVCEVKYGSFLFLFFFYEGQL